MSKAYIPVAVRRAVAAAAQHRCGYCLTQTLITGVAMQIDHIIPESRGGSSGNQIFGWFALDMNNTQIVKSRILWVRAGWHPPTD